MICLLKFKNFSSLFGLSLLATQVPLKKDGIIFTKNKKEVLQSNTSDISNNFLIKFIFFEMTRSLRTLFFQVII